MDSSLPLISVIIPSYNQARFLPAALESVLAQTHSHLEIWLVDDASSDATPKICSRYANREQRFHWMRQPHNQGPGACRNLAIRASSGNYIALLDSDDTMEPNRIALQLEAMESAPIADIVYTPLWLIDEQGNRIGQLRGQAYAPQDFLPSLFFRNLIPGPGTMLLRRTCFDSHLYSEALRHAEDYELMLRLAHLYSFKYLDIPLTNYRRHKTNLSNQMGAHKEAEKKILEAYSKEQIEKAVENSRFTQLEKTVLKAKIFFNLEWIEDCFRLLRHNPDGEAQFYLGNCYLKKQQPEAALSCYESALSQHPSDAASCNNRGVAFALLRQFEKAKDSFLHAKALKPGYLDPIYNLEQLSSSNPLFRPTWRPLRADLLPY